MSGMYKTFIACDSEITTCQRCCCFTERYMVVNADQRQFLVLPNDELCIASDCDRKQCNTGGDGYFVSPLSTQVGGDHYKTLAIQPVEYNQKNNLSWAQGEIVKYITRYKFKGGKQDLEKIKHLVDLLIGFEYSEGEESS